MAEAELKEREGRTGAPVEPTSQQVTSPIEVAPAAGGRSEEAACATHLDRYLSGPESRAWIAYLRMQASVMRRLEADLVAATGLPLAEYDVLAQLSLSDGGRLRMHELADRVLLSRAGLTRLIDRLVDDGLVQRAKCGGDGRGAFAVLTPKGSRRFADAAPLHIASVKRHFLDAYSPADLETLAGLLERAGRQQEP